MPRIWIFHAKVPQHGENPFLRTIFFKITTLLSQPVLPVFVFGESPLGDVVTKVCIMIALQMDRKNRVRNAINMYQDILGPMITEASSSKTCLMSAGWNGGT